MADLQAMSIKQLVAHREKLREKINELKAEFEAAGVVLAEKEAQTPLAQALRKIEEGRAELAALTAEAEEEGD